MLKAGADFGATGENPVVRGVADADGVLGPVGIVVADAILGEVTPAMAKAVGSCRAKKFLVPMNSCGVVVAGVEELPLPQGWPPGCFSGNFEEIFSFIKSAIALRGVICYNLRRKQKCGSLRVVPAPASLHR